MHLTPFNNGNAGRRKLQKSLHIDMTPMVDLGFLLISFFIFTSAMIEKKSISLSMPKAGEPIEIAESKTITLLLLQDNKVIVYEGLLANAISNNAIIYTNYDPGYGIRKVLTTKQANLERNGLSNSGEMTVLIKPLKQSSYNNLVNVLDEMLINGINKYAVVDPTPDEYSL